MKLTKKTNLIITSCILVVAIVVGIVTGIEFYDFSNYDTYFYTGNVDEIQKYSQYSPLLKGTVGDSNIYVMHGSENTVALIKAEDAQTYASVESDAMSYGIVLDDTTQKIVLCYLYFLYYIIPERRCQAF